MTSLRIVMADDHAHVRAHLRQVLEARGCDICGEGSTAQEAVDLALQHEPDVVLLDIHMPGNGISAAERIGAALPQTAVVMLTSSQEDEDLFDALKAGASGYLLKGGDPDQLYPALRGVLAGEAAMPPTLVSRILEEFRAPTKRSLLKRTSKSPVPTGLSRRELEVMQLLKEGKTTDEVATQLFLSPTTIRVHVSTVLRKLQVKDRESAFRLLPDE